jgi:hypothetical protein
MKIELLHSKFGFQIFIAFFFLGLILIALCRFDGKSLLTKFKGKQIMFIGDSVSLNQWQSLICLLHSAVPQARVIQQGGEPISNYTFQVSDPVSFFFLLK